MRGACRGLRDVVDGVVAASKIRDMRMAERSSWTVRIKKGVARITDYSICDDNGVVFEGGVLRYDGSEIVTSVAESVFVAPYWFITQPSGGVSVVAVNEQKHQLEVVATTRRADMFIVIGLRINQESLRRSLFAVHALTDEGVLLLLQYNTVARRVSAREVARGVRAIGMYFVLFNDGRLQKWKRGSGLVDVKQGVLWMGHSAGAGTDAGVWESADLKTISVVGHYDDVPPPRVAVRLSRMAERLSRAWHHAWA